MASLPPCTFLEPSEGPAVVDRDGPQSVDVVALCTWPDMYPERFAGAPLWLLRLAAAGVAVEPERNCVGCPAYRAAEGGHD
ncbi:hypothetical protein [Ancylobacter oerskovii]|uniref:Radical SAM protein n=1 Tax=Ancylobacter oerskovii TaxID=459519 RepID=A0ABW4YR82_9HYPH|nr:hypothetical protein [Ancylobacter oerskovii]MBS7545673.1 hypothetical protein [Ancylobacter oerskovii]